MNDLMNVGKTENIKQVEYLSDIRDVGMGIIFGQTTVEVFIDTFEKYLDYIETPTKYLKTLKEVSRLINDGKCSPDDLLIQMGKHTKEIEYEEPEIDYDCLCCCDDEDDLTELLEDDNVELLDIDDDTAELLIKILDKLCEE